MLFGKCLASNDNAGNQLAVALEKIPLIVYVESLAETFNVVECVGCRRLGKKRDTSGLLESCDNFGDLGFPFNCNVL